MKYLLMRKDEVITSLEVNASGDIVRFSSKIERMDIAPLAYRKASDWITKWWKTRSVPNTRGGIFNSSLKDAQLSPRLYTCKNLGLSLTDYYWIKPVGSNLKWKDVNFFENNFKENLFVGIKDSSFAKSNIILSPNSTLQGDLEKTWKITGGKRMLIKGNKGNLSEESINEVIASLVHKKQGYKNFVEYKLKKINNRNYDYGCTCKAFTNENEEFISAWDIIGSDMQAGMSLYEVFVSNCVKMGADEVALKHDLDYMIMTDYLISNRDRHMGNVGVLRDAQSLSIKGLAPIYDSGKSMFVDMNVPIFQNEILNNRVNSFQINEKNMLDLVNDRSLVDVNKLPTREELQKLYLKDSKNTKQRINEIIDAYEMKIEYFAKWQKQ